jgi:hypothetical protein
MAITEDELCSLLTEAIEAERGAPYESIVGVGSFLRSSEFAKDEQVQALIAAFEYDFRSLLHRDKDDAPFGPMMESPEFSYPMAPDAMPVDVLELWDHVADLQVDATVTARMTDLLWEARFGDKPHLYAQRAIESYFTAAVDGLGHHLDRGDGLARAVELATLTKDSTRRDTALSAIVKFLLVCFEDDEPMPGVILPLLELLVNEPPAKHPTATGDLVDRAVDRYRGDPFSTEAALDVKVRLLGPEAAAELHTSQVQAFVDLARKAAGMTKFAQYQHAIELAEQHCLKELADVVRVELAQVDPSEFELAKISAKVDIPAEAVDKFVGWFVDEDDAESFLQSFGHHVPIDDVERTREHVRQMMQEFPLQHLFTRIVLGPENSVLKTISEPEDRENHALVEHETQLIQIFGSFAVKILDEAAAKHGTLVKAVATLRTDLVDETVAGRAARAVELYEEGDYDSAASVLAPRLERLVRRIAATAGLAVTKSPDSRGRPGGVKGLGEILRLLEGIVPEEIRRYLRALLSDVTSLNLRNRVGHGLIDEASKIEAALLIHAFCVIARLVATDPNDGPS